MHFFRKTGLIIYSFLIWSFFVLSSSVLLPLAVLIWLLTSWIDRRLLILHLFSCFWASLYIWLNPMWNVRIEGRHKLPWKKAAVLVSNHQSMVDILVLYLLFTPYKWVSKKENFRFPFIGPVMRLNKYLEVDRASKKSYVKLIRRAGEVLQQGSPVLMFPEGTRFPGGSLGPFKEGAFKMALDNGVDIIPIILDGSARALPNKGAVFSGYTRIRVRVLDPIPHASFSGQSSREVMTMVRDLMEKEYARLHFS